MGRNTENGILPLVYKFVICPSLCARVWFYFILFFRFLYPYRLRPPIVKSKFEAGATNKRSWVKNWKVEFCEHWASNRQCFSLTLFPTLPLFFFCFIVHVCVENLFFCSHFIFCNWKEEMMGQNSFWTVKKEMRTWVMPRWMKMLPIHHPLQRYTWSKRKMIEKNWRRKSRSIKQAHSWLLVRSPWYTTYNGQTMTMKMNKTGRKDLLKFLWLHRV